MENFDYYSIPARKIALVEFNDGGVNKDGYQIPFR